MMRPSSAEKIAYITALASYFGLIALILLWETQWAPSRYAPPVFWLALKTLPLLIPLRGLLHARTHTYVWTSLLSLPYLSEGVTLAYADPYQRAPAMAQTVLALVLFTGCSLYAHLKSRRLKLAAST